MRQVVTKLYSEVPEGVKSAFISSSAYILVFHFCFLYSLSVLHQKIKSQIRLVMMQPRDNQINRFNENKVSGKEMVIIREILLRSITNISMERKDI